jgi:hypothetical protein
MCMADLLSNSKLRLSAHVISSQSVGTRNPGYINSDLMLHH